MEMPLPWETLGRLVLAGEASAGLTVCWEKGCCVFWSLAGGLVALAHTAQKRPPSSTNHEWSNKSFLFITE